jgi:hypothetical protein
MTRIVSSPLAVIVAATALAAAGIIENRHALNAALRFIMGEPW